MEETQEITEYPLDTHKLVKKVFDPKNKLELEKFLAVLNQSDNEESIEFLEEFADFLLSNQYLNIVNTDGDWEPTMFQGYENGIIRAYVSWMGWAQDEDYGEEESEEESEDESEDESEEDEENKDTAYHTITFDIDLKNCKICNYGYDCQISPG
jgi:hypothetical protein